MTPNEIIYHRRVRVMERARLTSVSEACRTFGVSRTTFYRWQRRVEGGGLDALMPKGRRAPAMPNQTPAWVVDELLAEAVVRPTLGARRYADGLLDVGFRSRRVACRRFSAVTNWAGVINVSRALAQLTAATTGLLVDDAREGPFGFRHFAASPRLPGRIGQLLHRQLERRREGLATTAVHTATRWAICEVFLGPSNTEIAKRFLDRVIRKLRRLGVRVTGVLTQRTRVQRPVRCPSRATQDHPSSDAAAVPEPQRGAERFQGTALQERRRSAFSPPPVRSTRATPRRIDTWLVDYNTRRANHSDFMRGRTPRQVLDEHRTKRAS